jgi:hypothetical protein
LCVWLRTIFLLHFASSQGRRKGKVAHFLAQFHSANLAINYYSSLLFYLTEKQKSKQKQCNLYVPNWVTELTVVHYLHILLWSYFFTNKQN